MLYLDNSATTEPYPEVMESYIKITKEFFANPSSLHKLGSQAEHLLRQARKQTANLLHVREEEIVFTSGGTEANNLAIKGTAFSKKQRGKHIITSAVEHPSVMESCLQLEKDFGFQLTILPVDENGRVSPEQLKRELKEDTILVSIMHVNNEVGTIQPIQEIANILKDYPNVTFHTDHVQGAAKVPLDLSHPGIDLCTLSAHKFHGLKGTGILFIKKGLRLTPLLSGGDQENQLRSGTESVAGIAAAAKALRMSMEDFRKHGPAVEETKRQILNRLREINGVEINTPLEQSAPHIIHFSVPGIKSEVLVHMLEEKDIFVSTTSACSSRKSLPSPTLLAMNKSKDAALSGIRISLAMNTDDSKLEKLFASLEQAIPYIMKMKR
ncbi:cysteine desulfurase [Bacillus sp. FJAT-42376]|uniref:cysteine desulfurase family protein n=1 Tax=Bacillus sp. FJAT-42376 TaxID=2014076 RepID=UPI000F5076AD|nr:cysteine desulfurase family protein [Bacillus sp. FJAT-42376]AZB43944.1 cysteine desulfurase [Bacillus sp. FJAT-42376]